MITCASSEAAKNEFILISRFYVFAVVILLPGVGIENQFK